MSDPATIETDVDHSDGIDLVFGAAGMAVAETVFAMLQLGFDPVLDSWPPSELGQMRSDCD
jgi:hypothetical protein